jgi:hypothetical protein
MLREQVMVVHSVEVAKCALRLTPEQVFVVDIMAYL